MRLARVVLGTPQAEHLPPTAESPSSRAHRSMLRGGRPYCAVHNGKADREHVARSLDICDNGGRDCAVGQAWKRRFMRLFGSLHPIGV